MDIYRKGVGIVLLNANKKVFVAQRIDTKSAAWQMPQGGVEENESPHDAALRELKEEIGTNKVVVISEITKWLKYEFPKDLKKSLWAGKYSGQEQKWFLMRFMGDEKEINLDTEFPEFSDWKWVEIENVEKMAIEFKRELYKEIIINFSETITNMDT
ncbi:MAG: RNA pyrophosphohydrolase [Rhodospirillaceae bacterium]|nr:RNA pyrophosphohydrolase [Rhodospirillaceae bacterium]